jgi:hypothetical protein
MLFLGNNGCTNTPQYYVTILCLPCNAYFYVLKDFTANCRHVLYHACVAAELCDCCVMCECCDFCVNVVWLLCECCDCCVVWLFCECCVIFVLMLCDCCVNAVIVVWMLWLLCCGIVLWVFCECCVIVVWMLCDCCVLCGKKNYSFSRFIISAFLCYVKMLYP